MLFLGKYAIVIEFEDGEQGFFMEVIKERGFRSFVGVTQSWESANKYISESSAEKDYWNNIHGLKSASCERIVRASIYKDGRTLISRLMD